MRKQCAILLAAALCLSLTACGKPAAPSMQLTKAALSREETAITELLKLDKQAMIYDYAVDETVKSVVITSYELDENGAWKALSGNRRACDDPKGRLAFSFELIANGMRIATQAVDGTGTSAVSHTPAETVSTDGMSVSAAFAGENIPVVYDTEIPLAVQIMTAKDTVVSYHVDYFSQPQEYQKLGYEHVYALTITFSQAPMQR